MEQVGLLADLAIIFGVSLVVVLLFHRFRLPPVPGFIVGGVLLEHFPWGSVFLRY